MCKKFSMPKALPKMVRIHQRIKEMFKGDNNEPAAVVEKLDMKTNKRPFQGMLNKERPRGRIH